MRAQAARNPRRQRRNQPLAVRRLPPLAPITRRFRLQHQVLNDDVLEALVARACRGLERKRLRAVDRKPQDAGAAPPLRRPILAALRFALKPIRRLLHAGSLLRRTRRQMLQPRNLVLQRPVLEPLRRQGLAQLLVLPPADAPPRQAIAEPDRSARPASCPQANQSSQATWPA
jgi:hypothetical protein